MGGLHLPRDAVLHGVADNFTTTTGVFWYDATIDQRGDFYSTLDIPRYRDPYVDQTGLFALLGGAQVGLFSARDACRRRRPGGESCQRNYVGITQTSSSPSRNRPAS